MRLQKSGAFFTFFRELARLGAAYHRAVLHGAERLPSGPALLVGNHGLFGLETPVFFYLLHQNTGRLPYGLADRRVFGAAAIRKPLERLGGVLGTRENALKLLRAGHHVVCYPGGSREVFKRPEAKYRLQWERASGFARVAIEADVPVVPFAGIGVDESFLNFGHLPLSRALLGRYAPPVALGMGALPLPVQFHFWLGEPLQAARYRDCEALKRDTQRVIEELIADAQTPLQPAPALS